VGQAGIAFEQAVQRRAASSNAHAGPLAEDHVPQYPSGPVVTQAGDLWVLGNHRLLCADARDRAAYESLFEGAKAEFVFTDPPYKVAIDGNVCGLGRIRHRDFAMASGEMSEAEFIAFLETVFERLAENTVDGSIHQICMDWRHMWEMLAAGRKVYSELKNLCVWNKTNAGMGSFYRSKHELVFVWKSGTAAHTNHFELGQHGRNRTNVWDYAGISSMRAGRLEELAMHPTVKPVALVADAIKDCSRRGGLVLDPFCGSGTILIAAERTGRKARALEIDPTYVDVGVRRWQTYTGKTAILAASGETFETIEEQRAVKPAAAA
jgi:DNA modification methylase